MAAEALSPSIDIPEQISKELKLTGAQVRSILALFEEKYTVPFMIAHVVVWANFLLNASIKAVLILFC